MIEIDNILDVEKYIDDIDVVIFDLDDTLYSEKEYVRSGFIAAAPDKADELWQAFLDGKQVFDEVIPERKEEALNIYRNHMPNIHLYPGVKDMIQRIQLRGKMVGIITDGRPGGQWNKMQALGLTDLISNIIVTDEFGGIEFRKPNQKAFEIIQKRLDIPFERMAYIGDNIYKDFIPCKKLGIMSIYFKNVDGIYFNDGE